MSTFYLFGDSLEDPQDLFVKIFARKSHILLHAFLEQASEVFKRECASRPGDILYSGTMQEIVSMYYQSPLRDAGIECAFTCISHFAHFIGFFEESPESPWSSHGNCCFIGVGVGLIVANVIASVDSLASLVSLAAESVRIAFKLGLYAGQIAKDLDQTSGDTAWSTAVFVSESEARTAIEMFRQEHRMELWEMPWISAVMATFVTISGIPLLRKRLIHESELLRHKRRTDIAIFAPFHASHIFRPSEVPGMVSRETRELFKNKRLRFNVYPTPTGVSMCGRSLLEACFSALESILLHTFRYDTIADSCTFKGAEVANGFVFGEIQLGNDLMSATNHPFDLINVNDERSWVRSKPPDVNPRRESDIAVVGLSARFPGADDIDAFWNLLQEGLDLHSAVPPDRFRVENGCGAQYVGNFLKDPGLFDAPFFNMSAREAEQVDPLQRLMLVTAYEALETAGIVPGRTASTKRDRIGTFYGQSSDDWYASMAIDDVDTHFIPGVSRAFGPGRINRFFGFEGPSFSIDTACSSSFAALDIACKCLRNGDCDTALVGGGNLLTHPTIFAGLVRGGFLSKGGPSKTWDDDADGYCRGDGIVSLVLKCRRDAISDRDPILGVIRGIGTNHSVGTKSISHPSTKSQTSLYRQVMRSCGVSPQMINYVEMHGTGTQVGDCVEIDSVSSVLAPRDKPRGPENPAYIGSLKPNIGHGEAVSGVSSLIKAVLILQKNTIPPHIGVKGKMNHRFPPDLHERGIRVATHSIPFPRPLGGEGYILITNSGAAGGNTAAIMTNGPEKERGCDWDLRSDQVVTISAKSQESLRRYLEKFLTFIENNQAVNLADLSYTTTVRRMHHGYRFAFTVKSVAHLLELLKNTQTNSLRQISSPPQIVLVFPGLGAEYMSMGCQLFDTCRRFRTDIKEFDEIARRQGFPSFLPLIQGILGDGELRPAVIHLALCCIQIALSRLWMAWGVRPSAVIGHSLGEYAALQVTGVLSLWNTIRLVGRRAILLETACTPNTHGMLALRTSHIDLQRFISDYEVEIACINGRSETVVSGSVDALDALADHLVKIGIEYKKLHVPFAFHSSQMESILPAFRKVAIIADYRPPQIPVISALLSQVIKKPGVIDDQYLPRQCREPVNFLDAVIAATKDPVVGKNAVWIEISPQPLCYKMIKSSTQAQVLPSLCYGKSPWETLSRSMADVYNMGIECDWQIYHEENGSRSLLRLPPYQFDEKIFWRGSKGGVANSPDMILDALPSPMLLTDLIQRVVSRKTSAQGIELIAESDLKHPALRRIISGHVVNGAALCPSSVYAAMAFKTIEYLYKLVQPDTKKQVHLCSMRNSTPLVLYDVGQPGSQVVRLKCTIKWPAKKATFVVSSEDSQTRHTYATCQGILYDACDELTFERQDFVDTQMATLRQNLRTGKARRFGCEEAYRMIEPMVRYSEDFKGMVEVIHDSLKIQAYSRVCLRNPDSEAGVFEKSPYLIETLVHLAAFVLSRAIDSTMRFVSSGWGGMRFWEPLEHGREYYVLASLKRAETVNLREIRVLDVFVMSSRQEIIGVVSEIKFVCLSPVEMDERLPPQPGPWERQQNRPRALSRDDASSSLTDHNGVRWGVSTPDAEVLGSETVAAVFAIIQKELHSPMPDDLNHRDELKRWDDNEQWEDLGIDSILSMTILDKTSSIIGLERSVFTDFPTVGSFRQHVITLSEGQRSKVINLVESQSPVAPVSLSGSGENIAGKEPRVRIVLGTAPFGSGVPGTTSREDTAAILELFRLDGYLHQDQGYREIDTARAYPEGLPGACEKLLGQLEVGDWAEISTKVNSFKSKVGSHKRENIALSVQQSVNALGKVDIMYLHCPDTTTPLLETLKAMEVGFQKGYFKYFGLSNFTVAGVEEVFQVLSQNNLKLRPTVYQGQYNLLSRDAEELITAIRRYEMRFYAYSPAAGGFLSGKIARGSAAPNSRWDPKTHIGDRYSTAYLREPMFQAARLIREAAEKEGISGHAAALRWTVWHSHLGKHEGHGEDEEHMDAVIIGASSPGQLRDSLHTMRQGPLPDSVVQVIEKAWTDVKHVKNRPSCAFFSV